MTLSCRAQAFSMDNLLRASGKATAANDKYSSPPPALSSQRQFPRLHAHSWTSPRLIDTPELLLSNSVHTTEQVLHSTGYENSTNELFLHRDLRRREELAITGQFKRGYQGELAHCYQIYKLPCITTDDNDNDGVQEDNIASRHSSCVDDNDDEQKGSRLREQYRASASSRVASSCFCHREMHFCDHPGVMTIADTGRSDASIVAELCHADLWASFHCLGTEMIITKSGRRMFPALKLRITGLNPDKQYIVRLEFLQPDTRKYRYIYHSSRWMVSGSGDKLHTPQVHRNPERSASGQSICSQIVSFERLKLTNTEPSRNGQVSLISMQKFQPQIVIQEVHNTDCSDVEHSEQFVITFPQTSFMAVTAYQNQQVTTLKIASNPFAKGFRESGKSRIPFESFASGLPNLMPCSTSGNYLPGVMKPPTWPHCFQRDFNSNFVNDIYETRSSVSAYEDRYDKIMQMEGKDCEANYTTFDMKRDNSSVDEALCESPIITATHHHLLPHESHPFHLHQLQQRDMLKEHQQLCFSKQQPSSAFLHPFPLRVELLQRISVPTVDILNLKDHVQELPIREMLFAVPQSEHIPLNVKSDHHSNQFSSVYKTTANTSSADIVPFKKVFIASEDDSPRCVCTRMHNSDNLVVERATVPTAPVASGSCVEHKWSLTSGHRRPSHDACVNPLPVLKPNCITEPTETDVRETFSRTECNCSI